MFGCKVRNFQLCNQTISLHKACEIVTFCSLTIEALSRFPKLPDLEEVLFS